jgi:para-aminobenzoate synthetase/4-amino-4-deoxychorismate lyase
MIPDPEHINCVVVQDSSRNRWIYFHNPVRIFESEDIDEVRDLLQQVESAVRTGGMFAAGFVNYEASPAFDKVYPIRETNGVPLIWFGVYSDFTEFDFPDEGFLDRAGRTAPLEWSLLVEESEYRSSLQRIKEYIKEGDTYQVNYSFRLKAGCKTDNWPFFVQMVHAQNLVAQPGYCAYVNTENWTVCSASPELFFEYRDRTLKSKPMKGTAPRGFGFEDDQQAGLNLQKSAKNRAENIMIADMVRNDMGRIADIGSVKTSEVLALEKYPTFWTMTTTVQCQTDPALTEIFTALFPAASITGAPKLRAMQIIDELEKLPRNIYTGSAGFLTPHNTAQFNVAIRTVLINKGSGEADFGVGGGIVWDSESGDEFQECHTKARVLTYSQPRFELIETMKWTICDGYVFLSQHLQRMKNSASYFSWKIDSEAIESALVDAAAGFGEVDQRVRVQLSKAGEIKIENTDFMDLPNPYLVKVALKSVSSRNYFLYHKTTYRNMYENAFAELQGCDDVLLWNEKGEFTESCRANLIVETSNGWFTPPVSCGLLNGIGRQDLIDRGEVQVSVIDIEQLRSAKSIWLVNSVRERWPVKLVN